MTANVGLMITGARVNGSNILAGLRQAAIDLFAKTPLAHLAMVLSIFNLSKRTIKYILLYKTARGLRVLMADDKLCSQLKETETAEQTHFIKNKQQTTTSSS